MIQKKAADKTLSAAWMTCRQFALGNRVQKAEHIHHTPLLSCYPIPDEIKSYDTSSLNSVQCLIGSICTELIRLLNSSVTTILISSS